MLPSEQPDSPRRRANIVSVILFAWVIPLFIKGYSRDLGLEDVFRVLPEDETKVLSDRMEAAWFEQVEKTRKKIVAKGHLKGKRPKPSLVKACVKVFGPTMILYGMCAIVEECMIKMAQPILLGYLLDYFHDPTKFKPYQGYLFALGVILCTISYTTADHPFTFSVQHLGMKMRISLCSLVYRKALRVSKYALEQTTVGQIVNFLSSDINRFDIFFTFFHYMWVAPLQLATVIGILYFHVGFGYASLSGLALLFVFVPFQGFMGTMFSKLRTKTAGKTDRRLLVLEEILSAIRVIKMYTWEKPFSDCVTETRRQEVKMIRRTNLFKALNQSFFSVTSRATLFITLLSYVLSGNSLTAKKVYITLSMYTSVQYVMTLFFPWAIISTAESLVSMSRIRTFLLLEERNVPPSAAALLSNNVTRKYDVDTDKYSLNSSVYSDSTASYGTSLSTDEIGIFATDISAQWNPGSKEMAFNKVTFDVRAGEILALIGPTASGKSSVLNSILYELPVKHGQFRVAGNVAYSCQEPWVFNGSVRENILFGKPYNSAWYDEVAEACALTRDFQLLPFGDHTLVGEKGTSLSGGQKARVTLARAVYSDADIYLMDDPLSAVDAQVGRHIMEKCLLGLLKHKSRILVTHQLQHLKHVDQIILLDDGTVAFSGDYKSLQRSGIPFTDLLNPNNDLPQRKPTDELSITSHFPRDSTSTILVNDKTPVMDTTPQKVGETVLEGPEEEEEYMATGSVEAKTYWKYFNAGSGLCVLFWLFMMTISTQLLFTGTDLWLKFWIRTEREINEKTITYSSHPFIRRVQESSSTRICIYTGLIFTLFLMVLVRTQVFYRSCMKSSQVVYDRLFYGVLRSPMGFFETTPIGRILNRFAKDISAIDENLPQNLYDCSEITMQTMGIIVIVGVNSPIMLIPSTLLVLGFYFLRKFYFPTARNIKRLEGVARSPIFSHLSASLCGLTTIRAFGVEQKFLREFETVQDVHSSTWYMFLTCARWLGVMVDWIAVSFISCVAMNFLIKMDLGEAYDSEVVGVSVSSAMMLTSMCQWGMRQSAEMENHMVAFERVQEYCNLQPEAALESAPGKKPPEQWPPLGEIRIKNLCLRYKEDSPVTVLKNISCTIHASEKVGIVGRTGAGKSSLINVLFRLAEPSSGYIEIDGIETTSIGLHDLRSKISIIPQEPVIFMGSIRGNLDPFYEYSDDKIWDALQEVKLGETVRDMDGGLQGEICEGGANFSSGQKQLLCLARAILKRNRILVLDEATASIDPETDRLIQRTIRRNFNECTVLTIAHRLHTVMDSDRILVLNAGQIMEFDEPSILLGNRHSMLYQLVQQTGKAEATNLAQIAKIAALRRGSLRPIAAASESQHSRGARSSTSSYTTITTDIII